MPAEILPEDKLFTIPEGAALLGIPVARLRRWTRGYTFEVSDNKHWSKPVIAYDSEKYEEERLLSGHDLAEIQTIDRLRSGNVSMAVIRDAADKVARLLNTAHPFAVEGLMTDWRRIYCPVELEAMGSIPAELAIIDVIAMQFVIPRLAQQFLERVGHGKPEDAAEVLQSNEQDRLGWNLTDQLGHAGGSRTSSQWVRAQANPDAADHNESQLAWNWSLN